MSWGITITASNGDTYTPDLYAPRGQAMPREIPAANGTPTLQFGVLPLDGAESWFDSKFENCDISVTKDGTDQPYSTLRGPRSDSAEGIIVLEADGGEELQRRVDESFELTETHTAAETVVTNNTSYGVDIPTPSTTTSTETLLDRSGGTITAADLQPFGETNPATVTGGNNVTLDQTLHYHDTTTTLSDIGDFIQFTITNDYTIPLGEVGLAFLADTTTTSAGLEMSIDGVVVNKLPAGSVFSITREWVQQVGSERRLEPGVHTVRIEVIEESIGSLLLQPLTVLGACVYDDRFDYDFDPFLEDGPQRYPKNYDGDAFAKFRTVVAPYAVVGADFSGTYTDAEGGRVVVENGVSGSSSDTGSTAGTFSGPGDRLDVKVGFKAYGSDSNQTPESGFNCETLATFTLDADLETMPLVSNERYQGTVAEVLTELADTLRGDFVWTFDTDGSGNEIVRFIRTGARTSTEDAIEAFDIQKYTEDLLEEVEVLGGPVQVAGEGVRVDYDTPLSLARTDIFEQSETVEYDGTVYERGVHYTIDYDAGEITIDSDPDNATAIPEGVLARVSYEFQPRATATVSGVSNPTRTRVVDGLPLRSRAACRLAAEQILDAASSPQYNASAEVRADTTFSVVTELIANRLPVSNLEVTDITATPAGSRVRLEARQTEGEVIADVRDRINNVAKHIR